MSKQLTDEAKAALDAAANWPRPFTVSNGPPAAPNLISERGRALIIAAAVLDRPDADPDDDMAILARQLTRAHEEVEDLMRTIKQIRITRP